MPIKGSCLCSQVNIKLDAEPAYQYVCHCTDCQKTSGSAMSTNFLVSKSKINISGPVKEYDFTAATGNTVSRIFCSTCGSAIAHGSSMIPDLQVLQTGNFPDFAKVQIEHEVHVKNRWMGLAPIPGAIQVDALPGLDFIQRARDMEKSDDLN